MRDSGTNKQSKEKGGTNMKKVHSMSKSIMSFVLAFAMAATMLIAAPAKEAKAAYAAPTGTTDVAHAEITDVTVTNVKSTTDEEVKVSFQQDNNGVNATFIRILLPSGTTVNTLQNLKFTISADEDNYDELTWDSALKLDGEDGDYTCNGADLYNKSYTLSINNKTYILAAGIAGGKKDVPSGETDIITNPTLNGIATEMKRDIIQSDYMGNPYFGEQGYKWTSVTYVITGETLPNDAVRTAVNLAYKLNGKDGNVAVDLTSGQKEVNINGVAYQVTASFGDVITISEKNYKIDLTELMAYLSDPDNTTVERHDLVYYKAREIIMAEGAYFGKGSHTFPAGSTAMDVMQAFLTYAYDSGMFVLGDSSRGENVSYIDYIDGLSYREVNQYAGWMYSDSQSDVFDSEGHFIKGSNLPNVMSDAYVLTKDTKITWFFTTNYMEYFK